MNIGRQFVLFVIVGLMLAATGCEKKKPRLPKQAKAPLDVVYSPLPPEIAQTNPTPPAPPPQEEKEAKVEEPKPQPSKRRKPHKQPPPTTAQTNPPAAGSTPNTTVAAAHPPAPDVAIAPDVTSAQLLQQKQTTAQLLESTEKTVNGLSQRLAHDQEEILSQIRSYVAQSRKATTDGDFERAYNLATKAHLLSDALVKQ